MARLLWLASQEGQTVWDYVVEAGEWSILAYALDRGANPTVLPQGIRAVGALAEHAGMDFGKYSTRTAEGNLTFLHLALFKKDVRAMTLALDSGADPNARSESGRTAAHFAVLLHWPDGLQLLSDRGAQLNSPDEDGATPFHLAAKMGDLELLEFMISRGANPVLLDKANRTALSYCLSSPSWALSSWMIKRCIALDSIEVNAELLKAFLKFAHEDNVERAKFFLESGLKLDSGAFSRTTIIDAVKKLSDQQRAQGGMLPMLHFAAKNNDVALAMYLKELGADFSLLDYNRRSVLQIAGAHGALAAAEYFLDQGVKINATDREGLSFVSYLVMAGSLDGVRFAFSRRSDLSLTAADGKTLLFFADSAEMVRLIMHLNPRLNVNWEDEAGRTALLHAQLMGRPSAMTALLSFGASLTQVLRKTGKTVVQQLRSELKETNNRDPHFRDILDKAELGYTSLHWAALFCDLSAAFTTMNRAKHLGDSTAMTKEAQDGTTPESIAEREKVLCPIYLLAFKEEADRYSAIKDQQKQDQAGRIRGNAMVALTTAVGCAGAIGIQIMLQSYRTLTSNSMLVAILPLLPFSASAGVVVALSRFLPGDSPHAAVALTAVAGAAGIALGVAIIALIVVGVEGRFLTQVKRWGTKRSDACWWIVDGTLCISVGFLMFVNELINNRTQDTAQLIAGLCYSACAIATLACRLNNIKLRPHLRVGTVLIIMSIVVATWFAKKRTKQDSQPAPGCILIIGALAASLTIDCLPSLVQKAVDLAIEMQAVEKESNKFQVTKLVLGRADAAAQGLEAHIGLTWGAIATGVTDGLAAMEQEIRSFGDDDDLDNFQYCAYRESLHPDHIPSKVQDSMRTGNYHGGTMKPEDFDTGHGGRTLSDWMKLEQVVIAKLTEAEFVAVRFYTSSSFWRINGPLRRGEQHPWPMVVYFLAAGIKKLRAVQAQLNPEEFACQTTLWRGMKNMNLDLNNFRSVGGTELAPMSTTTSEDVARHYAHSEAPLVFKYCVQGLKAGVSIQFLSLFPKEEEYLYPPLTFMTYRHHFEDDGTTVVVVEPVMS